VEHYCPLKAQPVQASSDIERIKMNPLRKSIAENMVKSFYQAPHATLMTEVDITDLITLVAKEKQTFLEQHNVKLSITAFVAKAIVDALKEFPLLNSSLENDTILVKKQINLGIAVSVDQGVMVPVIRGAQNLSLEAISKQISLLAEKARSQTLMTKDVQDGSITMTNFGMTGIQIGIPIIRYPEVAIIALGATTKKVAPMPDDTIAIRSVMMVTLTFDHRVLDGLYGCGFLNLLKKNLEEHAGLV
jgi:2-oxoglutarate dehydrogenase E2 component (dihydrolipoamide succinyltransferase)